MQLSLRFWQSLVMGQRIVSYTVSTGTYKKRSQQISDNWAYNTAFLIESEWDIPLG